MTDQQTQTIPESLIKQVVDARVLAADLERRLNDVIPNTIIVNRTKLVEQLKAVEQDVLTKHKEAIKFWQKSYKTYLDFLKRSPGTSAIDSPGERPKLGSGIENVRSLIRSFECLDDDKIIMSRTDWRNLFSTSGAALTEARNQRDYYLSNASTLTAGTTSLNFASNASR